MSHIFHRLRLAEDCCFHSRFDLYSGTIGRWIPYQPRPFNVLQPNNCTNLHLHYGKLFALEGKHSQNCRSRQPCRGGARERVSSNSLWSSVWVGVNCWSEAGRSTAMLSSLSNGGSSVPEKAAWMKIWLLYVCEGDVWMGRTAVFSVKSTNLC